MQHQNEETILHYIKRFSKYRACLHGGGELQGGEVTCGRSTHQSCSRNQIKMRDYMDRLVSPRKRQLPHLPGVPHLPVKTWPLFLYRRRNFGYLLFMQSTMLFPSFLIFSFAFRLSFLSFCLLCCCFYLFVCY